MMQPQQDLVVAAAVGLEVVFTRAAAVQADLLL